MWAWEPRRPFIVNFSPLVGVGFGLKVYRRVCSGGPHAGLAVVDGGGSLFCERATVGVAWFSEVDADEIRGDDARLVDG